MKKKVWFGNQLQQMSSALHQDIIAFGEINAADHLKGSQRGKDAPFVMNIKKKAELIYNAQKHLVIRPWADGGDSDGPHGSR